MARIERFNDMITRSRESGDLRNTKNVFDIPEYMKVAEAENRKYAGLLATSIETHLHEFPRDAKILIGASYDRFAVQIAYNMEYLAAGIRYNFVEASRGIFTKDGVIDHQKIGDDIFVPKYDGTQIIASGPFEIGETLTDPTLLIKELHYTSRTPFTFPTVFDGDATGVGYIYSQKTALWAPEKLK